MWMIGNGKVFIFYYYFLPERRTTLELYLLLWILYVMGTNIFGPQSDIVVVIFAVGCGDICANGDPGATCCSAGTRHGPFHCIASPLDFWCTKLLS